MLDAAFVGVEEHELAGRLRLAYRALRLLDRNLAIVRAMRDEQRAGNLVGDVLQRHGGDFSRGLSRGGCAVVPQSA